MAGRLTLLASATLFSQDGVLLFWLSAPTSAGMNVLGGVGPWPQPLAPQNPECTPTSSPFGGTPFPTLLPRVKKKKKEKKKKHFPISRCERKCLPRSSLALRPVLYHWTVPPGSSPRVGLLGPAEIKMELVKENVKKKKSQK